MRFVIHSNHYVGSLRLARVHLMLLFFASAHFGLIPLGNTWAQVPPTLPLPFPSPPPPLPEEGVPPPPPPSRIEPPPSVLPPAKPNLGMIRVFVREIKVVGSTVFSADELAKLTAPYVNRELTSEDLEALRMAVTLHYINNGYVTSGAVVPDQSMKDGVLTIQIVEGKLSRIDVEGNRWFVPGYIRKRIALGADPPLNINSLQERRELLQADPRFERLNAELKPGITRGESVLDVRVAEHNPLRMWLEFNNYQSPSVGAELGLVTIAHQNLTGHGDIASLQYGQSAGVEPQFDARYTLPLTVYDTTLFLQYRRNDFRVIEDQFESLNIKSRSEILGATVRQPLYRTLNDELSLAVTVE